MSGLTSFLSSLSQIKRNSIDERDPKYPEPAESSKSEYWGGVRAGAPQPQHNPE
jgi:hypothetical protein